MISPNLRLLNPFLKDPNPIDPEDAGLFKFRFLQGLTGAANLAKLPKMFFQSQDKALLDAIDSLNNSKVEKVSLNSKQTPPEATRSKIDDTLHQGAYPDAASNDF